MYRLAKKAIAQRQKLEAMRIGRERARMLPVSNQDEPLRLVNSSNRRHAGIG
jgi:hypothetical protein